MEHIAGGVRETEYYKYEDSYTTAFIRVKPYGEYSVIIKRSHAAFPVTESPNRVKITIEEYTKESLK